jgi:hypothetical protein
MNTDQLFEAIGEVGAEKLLHSEENVGKSRRPLRLVGILAAVVGALTALTLVVNATTDGAVLNVLRVWLNGEAVQTDDHRVSYSTDNNGNDVIQFNVDSTDLEFMAAKTEEEQEILMIQRCRTDENGQFLGFAMQVNRVEERDGKLILCYGGDEVEITEQFRDADVCKVDYSLYWDDVLKSHVLITVQRGTDGQYYIFTEPAK